MHSDKDIPTIHSSWNWNTAQECLSKIVSIQTDKSTVEKMLQTLFSSLLRNKTFEKLVIHTELPVEYNFWCENPNETFWVIFKQREFSRLSRLRLGPNWNVVTVSSFRFISNSKGSNPSPLLFPFSTAKEQSSYALLSLQWNESID